MRLPGKNQELSSRELCKWGNLNVQSSTQLRNCIWNPDVLFVEPQCDSRLDSTQPAHLTLRPCTSVGCPKCWSHVHWLALLLHAIQLLQALFFLSAMPSLLPPLNAIHINPSLTHVKTRHTLFWAQAAYLGYLHHQTTKRSHPLLFF